MTTKAISGFIHIDIMICPIERPQCSYARTPATNDGYLFPARGVSGPTHGEQRAVCRREVKLERWS
jgi:hypothetical protein